MVNDIEDLEYALNNATINERQDLNIFQVGNQLNLNIVVGKNITSMNLRINDEEAMEQLPLSRWEPYSFVSFANLITMSDSAIITPYMKGIDRTPANLTVAATKKDEAFTWTATDQYHPFIAVPEMFDKIGLNNGNLVKQAWPLIYFNDFWDSFPTDIRKRFVGYINSAGKDIQRQKKKYASKWRTGHRRKQLEEDPKFISDLSTICTLLPFYNSSKLKYANLVMSNKIAWHTIKKQTKVYAEFLRDCSSRLEDWSMDLSNRMAGVADAYDEVREAAASVATLVDLWSDDMRKVLTTQEFPYRMGHKYSSMIERLGLQHIMKEDLQAYQK